MAPVPCGGGSHRGIARSSASLALLHAAGPAVSGQARGDCAAFGTGVPGGSVAGPPDHRCRTAFITLRAMGAPRLPPEMSAREMSMAVGSMKTATATEAPSALSPYETNQP